MEITKDQVSKRLTYLWHMKENYPRDYMEQGLNKEKNLIYQCYGSDNEVMYKAHIYFYHTEGAEFNKILKEGSAI